MMDEQTPRSYSGEEHYYSPKDKIKPSTSRSSGRRLLPIFIGITTILLVAVIVLGAVIVHLLTTPPQTSSRAQGSATSTTIVPTPSATPGSTATSQTISKNLTIPCVDCGGSGPITLELNKIVISVSQNKTLFYFTITNIGSSDIQEYFSQIQLQNPEDASMTTGDGQGDGGAGWNLGPGNNIIHITTFPFIPKQGVKYTLLIKTNYYTYQNETLTF